MTVLGISSPLHTWNPSSERFISGTGNSAIRNTITVDGKCEILTSRQDFILFLYFPQSYQLLEQHNSSISRHRHSPASFGIAFIVTTITVSILKLTLNNHLLPSFLGQQKKVPLSMLSHILSPLHLFTSETPLLAVHLLMLG